MRKIGKWIFNSDSELTITCIDGVHTFLIKTRCYTIENGKYINKYILNDSKEYFVKLVKNSFILYEK